LYEVKKGFAAFSITTTLFIGQLSVAVGVIVPPAGAGTVAATLQAELLVPGAGGQADCAERETVNRRAKTAKRIECFIVMSKIQFKDKQENRLSAFLLQSAIAQPLFLAKNGSFILIMSKLNRTGIGLRTENLFTERFIPGVGFTFPVFSGSLKKSFNVLIINTRFLILGAASPILGGVYKKKEK
jgi:hypothetical protein